MKDKKITSVETFYNGYKFRSRTEARWAVFFDAIGLRYYYEYEDFILPSKGRYLPDFYFPDLYLWAEVKPYKRDEYVELCEEFAKSTGRLIILLDGVPDFKAYPVFHCMEIIDTVAYCDELGNDVEVVHTHKGYDEWVEIMSFCRWTIQDEHRLYFEPYVCPKTGICSDCDEDAIHASRAARFESFF